MRRSLQPRGFTLVELLVSLAIALLLIVGVNAVFSTTAKTVGAGQSLLSAGRDARTFLRTMYIDMNEIDPVATPTNTTGDPVCLLIQSSHVYAFRNFDDQQAASNQATPWQDTTLFPTSSPLFSNNTAPVPFVHFRSHRIDKFGFFARGLFTRQTSSNANSFTSSTTSAEAWILYEHPMQPNKSVINNTSNSPSNWFSPGAVSSSPSNDYNYYSADWMLGRLAILLVPTPFASDTPYLLDHGGLTPLTTNSVGSASIPNEGSSAPTLSSSRLDIAGTSIEDNINGYGFGDPARPNGLGSYGYTGLYNFGGSPVSSTSGLCNVAPNYNAGTNPVPISSNSGTDWWDPMINQRIRVSPYLLTPSSASPTAPKLDPYGLATAAPSLVRGCTQFIVEYAGNYYTKDPTVYPPNTQPDGRPLVPQGYIPAPSGSPPNTPPTPINTPIPDPNGVLDYFVDANGNRRIRWYGFPRLVLLNNAVSTPPVLNATYGMAGNSAYDAVIPLRDVLHMLQQTTPAFASLPTDWGTYANAERFSMTPSGFSQLPPATGTYGQNYWQVLSPTTDSTTPYIYTAAWGADSTQPFPKMIRIIICIDDHEGRLPQPQFYEYIFDVQQ